MQPFRGYAADPTYCDAHAGFRPDQIDKAVEWLRVGLLAGLIGEGDRLGDPAIAWAPSTTGWLFEARITEPGSAIYHGYPVLPSEAIAAKVLNRFEAWASEREGFEELITLLRSKYKW